MKELYENERQPTLLEIAEHATIVHAFNGKVSNNSDDLYCIVMASKEQEKDIIENTFFIKLSVIGSENNYNADMVFLSKRQKTKEEVLKIWDDYLKEGHSSN